MRMGARFRVLLTNSQSKIGVTAANFALATPVFESPPAPESRANWTMTQ